jgi:glycosyltransferase involved in cell wall biosynthesis
MANCNRYLFYLAGDRKKASSRVRGYWISEGLEKQGIRSSLRYKQGKWQLLLFAFSIFRYDVIVFQKTYSRYHRYLMSFANYLGKITCLDLDDAPSRICSPVTLANVESMIKLADVVFLGSPELMKYAKQYQKNCYLIPSGINLNQYPVPDKSNSVDEVITLGWIGDGRYYADDLSTILARPLAILARRHRIKLVLIGVCEEQRLYDVFGNISGLEVEFVDTLDWGEGRVVADVLGTFDIGLYPLLPNAFNKYKCGFKALEYMAVGLPVVASPVAVNATIICDGVNGALADSQDEWVSVLNELIENKDKRDLLGLKGREKIEQYFDVNKISAEIARAISAC